VSLELTSPTGELERICPECGSGFTVDSAASRRKYCSPACRETGCAHLPKQRVCPQCDQEFTTDLSRKRKYCSAECRTASRRGEDQQETRTCPVCENPFLAAKTVRTRYCSMLCRREAEHVRGQALDEERARRLGQAPPAPTALPARIELPPAPVRPASRQAAAVRDPLEPTATRNCPHCQQPITIVALLATPRSRPAHDAAPPHRHRPAAAEPVTDPFTLRQVDELVTRSHSDGLTDLAVAALIEQHGRSLLVHGDLPDLNTPRTWRLPSGPVLPGETVPDGLHRILPQYVGYADAEITGFLGIVDADDSSSRTFVLAVNTGQPDSICHDGQVPHRWIDNITISDLIPEISPVLRTYYAHDPG
jgi:endogenous inhibitor of DNA gyrase (YacG/DUF329 family)